MEGSAIEDRLCSLPFLVVELESGILLKRGTTELLIEGDTALETILLILTATTFPGQTREDIALQFPEPDRTQIIQLLDDMVAKRLLVPAERSHFQGNEEERVEDVFYWTGDATRKQVVKILNDLNITLVGVNMLSQKINQSLSNTGVSNVTVVDDPALRNIACFDDGGNILASQYENVANFVSAKKFLDSHGNTRCLIATSDFGSQSFLLPWNETCVVADIHFMPVYLQDMIGYAGPLVIPGETACLQCLRMRQNAHLQNRDFTRRIEAEMQRGQSVAAVHPSMTTILAETVVFELCHFYGALPGPRPGRLIKINLPAGVTESKRVLKIPRCPVCSNLTGKSAVQIRRLTQLPE